MERWTPEEHARLEALTNDERNYPTHDPFICAVKEAGPRAAANVSACDPHLLYCARVWHAIGWGPPPACDPTPEHPYGLPRYSVYVRAFACLVRAGIEAAGSFHQLNNGGTRVWYEVHGEMPWR